MVYGRNRGAPKNWWALGGRGDSEKFGGRGPPQTPPPGGTTILTVVSMLFAVFKNKLKLRRSVSESEHDRTQENILFLNRSL